MALRFPSWANAAPPRGHLPCDPLLATEGHEMSVQLTPEPDPRNRQERRLAARRSRHSRRARDAEAQTLAALAQFDCLPDAAYVKRRVVQALFGGISDEEVRRRTLDGRIPIPTKLGTRVNIWQVGELREALARLHNEAALPVPVKPDRAPPPSEPEPPPQVPARDPIQPPARHPDTGRRRHAQRPP
jgi:hypothetical protein